MADALVARGLAESRTRAEALVLAGRVKVKGPVPIGCWLKVDVLMSCPSRMCLGMMGTVTSARVAAM